jgi:hypothetical protein
MTTRLAVPYPPETIEQARAWVVWAETEIGTGFHPDTKAEDYVHFGKPISYEAYCNDCGETFCPDSPTDLIHGVTESTGEPCGGAGEYRGAWGAKTVRLITGTAAGRFDEGLEAAHTLLPDIYETSMQVFKELHPEVFE